MYHNGIVSRNYLQTNVDSHYLININIRHKDKGIKGTNNKEHYHLNLEHVSRKNHSLTIGLTYPAR